jgi:hypothetical protein
MKNRILAIAAKSAAMPPKPNKAAINANTRKVKAHCNISYDRGLLPVPPALADTRDCAAPSRKRPLWVGGSGRYREQRERARSFIMRVVRIASKWLASCSKSLAGGNTAKPAESRTPKSRCFIRPDTCGVLSGSDKVSSQSLASPPTLLSSLTMTTPLELNSFTHPADRTYRKQTGSHKSAWRSRTIGV